MDQIEALAEKDDRLLQQGREVEVLRRAAALELHRLCSSFVGEINAQLSKTKLEFDPPEYDTESLRTEGPNLFQINVRGRIVQVEFEAGEKPVSTEEFRVPYILEGAVRCFNQDLLDREAIQEHLLFCCLERRGTTWRFFDPRSYRTGLMDAEYLVTLLETLL